MKPAQFFKPLKNKIIQCQLCPHFCVIKESMIGKCHIRKNIDGKLYSLSYGKPISIALDPITKKPLYHFLPNTFTFSIGMAGCNFQCIYCQNFSLSQSGPEDFSGKEISPEELINQALDSGCPSISYTYSEPLISFEYVFECSKIAKKNKLKNILVTNGFINKEPFEKISSFIDAMNIDLKGDEKFYEKYCGGKLKPVLDVIKMAYGKGIHIELTTLIIPGLNDSEKTLKEIANFIASIDKNIPWHISRFFPMYKMLDKKATPIESLELAERIGKDAGLKYVHLGNV